jgi:hypothetical protein
VLESWLQVYCVIIDLEVGGLRLGLGFEVGDACWDRG